VLVREAAAGARKPRVARFPAARLDPCQNAAAKVSVCCFRYVLPGRDGTPLMNQITRRNRLLPWYIGIAVVLVAVIYVGYQMFFVGCPAPTIVELGVLVVIPVVYLVLMYLTLTSQD
jgi:hypothetical protein